LFFCHKMAWKQCCGSETIFFRSWSHFHPSFGSGFGSSLTSKKLGIQFRSYSCPLMSYSCSQMSYSHPQISYSSLKWAIPTHKWAIPALEWAIPIVKWAIPALGSGSTTLNQGNFQPRVENLLTQSL
jgi:hypothetical protein